MRDSIAALGSTSSELSVKIKGLITERSVLAVYRVAIRDGIYVRFDTTSNSYIYCALNRLGICKGSIEQSIGAEIMASDTTSQMLQKNVPDFYLVSPGMHTRPY